MNQTVFYLLIIECVSLQADVFPPGVSGTACYDYFAEYIPPGSKGVYKIFAPDNSIKYIGSSLDIDRRLSSHHKKGLLERGDLVQAIIFHANVRQKEILDYERSLIRALAPPFNKHVGAPGRSWRSEQILKLQIFLNHNERLLLPEGKVTIRSLLSGKKLCEDHKMERSLLRIMKWFL